MRPWRRLALVFVILASSLNSAAENPQRSFLRQFQSSRLSFPDENSKYAQKTEGQYPGPLRFLFQDVLGWEPSGESRPLTDACSVERWSARLQDPRARTSVQLQGALIQKYFKDCADELETGNSSAAVALLRMMTMKYEPQKHPFLHRVVLNLPGNIKLKGLLGLKGDLKKRPLVVLRLGIFANVEEFLPERAWLMMLFEQSPFNVLMLENMTGTDFVADNSRFSFGGYDEALQNILVAQILKDPKEPLSRLVGNLHLFGVSLGGHGVLYTSLLNGLNSPKGQPLYQSFVGMCPVVNLKDNMEALTTQRPFAYVVDLWSQKRLGGLAKSLPAIQDHDSFAFLKQAVSEVVRSYRGGLSYVPSLKLPAGLSDGADFWALNNFWKYYKNVSQPVMIFANEADVLVPFSINSQLLQNKSMKIDSGNLSVVAFSQGIHCTLPIPYHWKAVSGMLQTYFLSHSPDFKLQKQSLDIELEENFKGFFAGPVKTRFIVQPLQAKDTFVRLAVEFENEKGRSDSLKLNLPLSQFDFHFLNKELSESEQTMVVRWLHQNLDLKVLSRGGLPILRATWSVAP